MPCARWLATVGASGRLFSDGPAGRFFLLSRQSFAAEHAGGFSGAFRIEEAGTKAERRLTYEAICASERPGYRNVTVIGPDKSTRDVHPMSETQKPAPAYRDMHNLYWAACRKQFRRFR